MTTATDAMSAQEHIDLLQRLNGQFDRWSRSLVAQMNTWSAEECAKVSGLMEDMSLSEVVSLSDLLSGMSGSNQCVRVKTIDLLVNTKTVWASCTEVVYLLTELNLTEIIFMVDLLTEMSEDQRNQTLGRLVDTPKELYMFVADMLTEMSEDQRSQTLDLFNNEYLSEGFDPMVLRVLLYPRLQDDERGLLFEASTKGWDELERVLTLLKMRHDRYY